MVARHVSAFAPTPDALVAWGADYGPLTTHGQWWRLVTATFVHIGLTHLLVNMFALFVIGRFTERLFGNTGFLVLYLLGGIAASLTSLSIHPTIVSAGASGAIFALYGGLIGFLLVRRSAMSYATATSLALNAAGFVAFNLFYGLTKAHIDMAAHVGGLLAGVPIGAAMAFDPATTTRAERLWRSALVCIFGAAILMPVARRIPVLDDWPREFASWMSLTRDTATRLNQLREKKDGDQAPAPEEIADRIDRQLVPPLDAERARLEKLRLLPEQQAVARKAIAYLTLQAEALRMAAEAERTGDAALNSQASAKGDQAAEVLQSILPDPKLAAALAERKAIRASIEALSAEIKKISDIEHEQAQLYGRAVADYRAKRIREEELATLIEKQLLPPWLAEQEALAKVQVVPAQEPLLKKFQEVHVASRRGLAPDRERPALRRPAPPRTGQREAESREETDGAINESLAPRPLAARSTRLTERPAPGRRAAPGAPWRGAAGARRAGPPRSTPSTRAATRPWCGRSSTSRRESGSRPFVSTRRAVPRHPGSGPIAA